MTYHIARDGAQLGTFSEDLLPSAIENGTLLLTDLAWTEGMTEWEPLGQLVNVEVLDEDGAVVPPTPTVSPSPPPPPSRVGGQLQPAAGSTSGMAVASLVCGIASLLLGCLAGIPAIICGILAIKRIGQSSGGLSGRGMAVTGLVLGCTLSVVGTIAILAGLAVPAYSGVQEKARQMQAQNNARQIALMLKSYAADNNGMYPDSDRVESPQTSNDAFRVLFKIGLAFDEKPFTAALSPYEGDNDIGEAPEYANALAAGENHWAMSKGMSDSASGLAPLLFENPVPGGAWPPTWNCDARGTKQPGRAWRDAKIIIARNDNSVSIEALESRAGGSVGLKQNADGKDLFTQYADQGEYLDVQR